MASTSNDQDLLPDQTEGFKVGEKKTMDEYHKLGTFFYLLLAPPDSPLVYLAAIMSPFLRL
jgi:hypothetical protein